MNLPVDLQIALENELQGISSKDLTKVADRLSMRYRSGDAHGAQAFLQSQIDVITYGAYRLPATFGAIYAACMQIQALRLNWCPQTMLDVGAGPGTAMWAVMSVWPELKQIILLDRDDYMIALGKRLAMQSRSEVVRQSEWRKTNLAEDWGREPYELVTAAYVLGELPTGNLPVIINRLWTNTTDTLLLVEPGTPRGFEVIRRAREQLIATGANVTAPCPHNLTCPMSADDWCHFSQRIARARTHRNIKNASLSYEDEKFSYVAVSRSKGLSIQARVVRHPQTRPKRIALELCTCQGLERTIVTRSDREKYRQAGHLKWGSAVGPTKVSDGGIGSMPDATSGHGSAH